MIDKCEVAITIVIAKCEVAITIVKWLGVLVSLQLCSYYKSRGTTTVSPALGRIPELDGAVK